MDIELLYTLTKLARAGGLIKSYVPSKIVQLVILDLHTFSV